MPDKHHQEQGTANLIDSEPILFFGCSSSEIMVLALLGFVTGLLTGVVLAFVFGSLLVAVPFPLFGAFIGVVKGGKRLGKSKEGKPDGYYSRVIKMKLCKFGLTNLFVHRMGGWRTRR